MAIVSLLFGISSYLIFFYTIVAFIAFFANFSSMFPDFTFIFPFRIDSHAAAISGHAILINTAFILLFAIQHSTMARNAFKQFLTRFFPQSMERSLYVLVTSLILLFMMAYWQPMTMTIWQTKNPIAETTLWGVFLFGWGLMFLSSFIINHFDLFGLRQTFFAFMHKEYTQVPFQVKSLYKFVRHPLYLGLLLGMWSTPHMTVGHLWLAAGLTIYLFIGMYFEEKDMGHYFGDAYKNYKQKTPRLIPFCCPASKHKDNA